VYKRQGIGKIRFEIDYSGFNSMCLKIQAWNYDNCSKKPNIEVAFDSCEYGNFDIKDITEPKETISYDIKKLVDYLK